MAKAKSGGKICPKGKAWAKRTFDTYPSAYANMAASKYCKDPNYAKGSKKKAKKMKNGGTAMTIASAKALLKKNGFTVTKTKKKK